jgi:hypothetical protein
MCHISTSDQSFQNHHLAGTCITVKLALLARYYGSHISAQDTSLRFRFQPEYLGLYLYLVIRKVAMCQFSTSDESLQNRQYLVRTLITVKLALPAGPFGQLFELAIKFPICLYVAEA